MVLINICLQVSATNPHSLQPPISPPFQSTAAAGPLSVTLKVNCVVCVYVFETASVSRISKQSGI